MENSSTLADFENDFRTGDSRHAVESNPNPSSPVNSPYRIMLRGSTDIALDGSAEIQWLFATTEKLVVVRAAEPAACHFLEQLETIDKIPANSSALHTIPISDIEAIRTSAGTGSGLLQVKNKGSWINVLRYSNALADLFHHISRGMERLRNPDLASLEEPIAIEGSIRCPDCNLRLGHQAESCPRCLHHSKIASRVWDLVRPQVNGALILCALTIAGVAAELVPPKLQQYMVDNILADHSTTVDKSKFITALLVVVLALAGSRVVLSLVGWFKGRLATRIGSSLTYYLRGRMVERLQQLAIAYYDRHQVGSLMSRVAYDSEVLQGLLHQLTGGFLLQILQLFGVGAMLVWLNPKLAFYTLIPVPLVILGTMYFWRYVYPRYYRLWDSSSKQIAALSGMLSGIRVVKAFAQENREFQKYDRASVYLRDSRLWVDNTTSAYSAAMQVVFSMGGLIVWYVGGRDVIGQEMTLGQLIAFLAYLAMFYAPLATLSNFTTWLTSFLTGSKRVLELLDTPVTIAEPESARTVESVHGEIKFENVTFGYDRHQPVIHNVSFTVAPGEMVGIVGRSGSGKTTMINLLGRFYDVQEGRILVDGVNICEYALQSLRRNIGIVFQESFLFRGTIWENLTYGRSTSTIREGLRAAKAAGAHDFICRSGLAYETPLGEGGAGLSGGEKQRLSIARTLLYDPKILILDEATSNIDAEAEKSIQQALDVLIKGRTTIAIAHRLSTLRNADRIIVFDRGRLIEQGSHNDLLKIDGTYARLVRLQTQISKEPSVDKLASLESTPTESFEEGNGTATDVGNRSVKNGALVLPDSKKADECPPNFLKWLEPNDCQFECARPGCFSLKIKACMDADGQASPAMNFASVFAISCFPASRNDLFISIRAWNENDEEVEVGMIEDLSTWPGDQKRLVSQSLAQRYLLPKIVSVESISSKGGYLDFKVTTDRGPNRFTLRWSHSQAQDFGDRGKLLIDTEENRFVIDDVDHLPRSDQERFRQYIYW